MKKLTFLFLLILSFSPAEAQPDSVQILEMTGDSLLAAGDFEAASRAYFYAFYKNPDSKRLEEKFQFLGLEKKPNREQKKLFRAKYFQRKAALKFADFDYETAEVFYEYSLEFAPDSATEAALEKLKTVRLLEQKAGEFAHKILIDSAIHFYEKAYQVHPNPYFTEQIAHLHRADSIIKAGLVGTKFVQIKCTIYAYPDLIVGVVDSLKKRGHLFPTKDGFYLGFFPKEHFLTEDKVAAFFRESYLHIERHEGNFFDLACYNTSCPAFLNVYFGSEEPSSGFYFKKDKNFMALSVIVEFMKSEPSIGIAVRGHAAVSPKDGKSKAEKLALSKRRALEVIKYLVDRGIEPYRFEPFYLGGNEPHVREIDDADIGINRYVSFKFGHSIIHDRK